MCHYFLKHFKKIFERTISLICKLISFTNIWGIIITSVYLYALSKLQGFEWKVFGIYVITICFLNFSRKATEWYKIYVQAKFGGNVYKDYNKKEEK